MKCSTKYCRNESAPGRVICWKCKSHQLKINNPVTYFLNALRVNAKRRNKQFDLTLEQFKKFCTETGYLNKKGRHGDNLSIDRIRGNEGYSINNIQVLTVSENVRKEHNVDYPF